MLEEITLPDDYTGTLAQENEIIDKVNRNFYAILNQIIENGKETFSMEEHIVDFEGYQIEIFFSENKSSAKITTVNDTIVIDIAGKTIRIDADGNIV
jgi:hypothetical protein